MHTEKQLNKVSQSDYSVEFNTMQINYATA